MPKRPGIIPALIVLVLLLLARSQSVGYIWGDSGNIGIDFYHFWGVPAAMRLAPHELGSPYGNGPLYSNVLIEYADKTPDPRLKAASSFWGARPDFTASPLLYTTFSHFSDFYTVSLVAFRKLQLAIFLTSFVLLGYFCRLEPFHIACLAPLLVLFYQPLASDVRVGNVGCFQFASLTCLLFLADAVARATSFARRAALGAVFLGILAALTLCKPNVVVVSALLAAHLAVRHGPRVVIASALPAAAATAVLVVIPCLYFGSWTVWREWYEFVYGSNAHMLVRLVVHGNYSTALLLSSWLGADVYAASTVLLAMLGASFLAAVSWTSVFSAPMASGAGTSVLRVLRRTFGDPQLVLTIGIVLTAAASPLYWFHYYLLSLIPTLWLLSTPESSKYLAALGAATVVLSSGVLEPLLLRLPWPDVLPSSIALSWLPLWCAVLLRVGSPDAEAMPAREADLAGQQS